MKRSNLLLGLTLVVSIAAAACSTDSPTAPRSLDPSASAGMTPIERAAFEAAKAAKKAAHDRLLQLRDSIRDVQKANGERDKNAFELLKKDWSAYKKVYAKYKKANLLEALELLRCAPTAYAGDAEVIGPDGGELKIGPHKIVIPKGALDHEELIQAETPMGDLVQVKFGPHGLNFLSPAELTLSYGQCLGLTEARYRIVYATDDASEILELLRSKDSKPAKSVTAPIGHFSSYMIAY